MLATPQPEAVKAVWAAIRSTCQHEMIDIEGQELDAPVHTLIGYAIFNGICGEQCTIEYPEIRFGEADVLKFFGAGAYYDSWPYADQNGNPVYETVYIKHDIEWLDQQPQDVLLAFADALCGYTSPKK